MKYTFLCSFLLISGLYYAQSTTDQVLEESCECIENSNDNISDYESYMGLLVDCMSTKMIIYSDELQEEMGIEDGPYAMEQMGEKLGERLALECPKFMELTMKVMGQDEEFQEMVMDEMLEEYEDDNDDFEFDDSYLNDLFETVEGKVLSVSDHFPCEIKVENDEGETLKLYWLDYIVIDDMYVSSPKLLVGKKIEAEYMKEEYIEPSKGEYVTKKLLITMDVM